MALLSVVFHLRAPSIWTLGGPFAPQAEHLRPARSSLGRVQGPALATIMLAGQVTL